MSAQKTPISRTLANYVNQQVVKHLAKLGMSLPGTVASVNGSIVTVNFQVSGLTLPQVKMPLAGPEYIRYPTQVGDKGFCVSADFYLGAMTGLGSGTAGSTQRGNLSTLVFYPIGNANWSATDDAQAVVIYGPNGVIIRDSNKKTVLTLTPDNFDVNAKTNFTVEAGSKASLTVGSRSVTVDGTNVTLVNGSTQIQLTATTITFVAGGITMTLAAAGLTVGGAITGGLLTGTGLTMSGGGGNANLGTGTLAAADATLAGKTFSTHKHSGVTTGGGTSGPPV